MNTMCAAAWAAAVRPETRLFYMETPSNPLTEVGDIAAVAEIARDLRQYDKKDDFTVRYNYQLPDFSAALARSQLKRLGASCDWPRERFTMDEGLSQAVRKVFVQLYDEGLIYRGDYIINWCHRCHTALADLEVEHEDVDGHLYHIRYPFKHGTGGIVVATTRPETMLGDTAVAVNPDDERYRDLKSEAVMLPLMDREIPIIKDDYVDMSFGTGALKVTPAHDPNDFEIGRRHDLPSVKVIGENGKMTSEAGRFEHRAKGHADDEVQHVGAVMAEQFGQ